MKISANKNIRNSLLIFSIFKQQGCDYILMKYFIFLFSPFFLISNLSIAQSEKTKLDSFNTLINNTKNDTARLKIIEQLIEFKHNDGNWQKDNEQIEISAKNKLKNNLNSIEKKTYLLFLLRSYYRSSLTFSENGNYNTAIEYCLKALKISFELEDLIWISKCNNNLGNAYADQGLYDDAIYYYLKALKIDEELGNKSGMSSCYNNMGLVYSEQGLYNKAIENYLKALKINEESGDKLFLSNNYTNIGLLHYEQGNLEKAIEYFLKSLKIDTERNDKYGKSACYNNLGLVFADQKLYDKAIEYYTKSLEISQCINDKRGLAKCYNNIGHVYKIKGNYETAIIFYLNSLKIGEELGDKNGITTVWSNLASLHIALADSVSKTKEEKRFHYNQAVQYGLKSLELAKEINAIPRINAAADRLYRAYKMLGNIPKSLEYAELLLATKDSMFNTEKTKALAGLEAKFKDEKRQLEIAKLAKEKELQTSEMKKQKIIIWFMISGLLFIALISIVLFRLFLQKKKANYNLKFLNTELNKKNIEIENQRDEILTTNEILLQQKEEIETQRDEIEAQRDVATQQRDLITHQKKELTDSINYAQRIQRAILPPSYYVSNCLPDNFVLYLPKDVVSGDFYYVEKFDEYVVFAAVDCTGHGVPGSMMSVIGYNLINQAVKLNHFTKPSDILSFLDAGVTDTLRQEGGESGVNDGMDIAVCTLNTKTNRLQFAGAYNGLVYIKGAKLTEIKADNLAIGVNYDGVVDSYTNHEIQLEKGDLIYMYSDGFADQFGGPKGKKYKYKKLKEFILQISSNSMIDQKEKLIASFNEWKGDLEQVDDVMMIGVRI